MTCGLMYVGKAWFDELVGRLDCMPAKLKLWAAGKLSKRLRRTDAEVDTVSVTEDSVGMEVKTRQGGEEKP